MIRILHCVIGNMDEGGLANNLMTVYRNIDRTKYQFDFITHSLNDDYKSEIEQLGGRIFYVEFKSEHPFLYWKHMNSIMKKHTEYDYVHIHTSYALMYFDAKIAKKYGKKIIVHSHTSSGNGKKQIIINRLLKNSLDKLADYRLAVSDDAAKWLFSDISYKNANYLILNNSIDTEKFYYDLQLREIYRGKWNITNEYVVGITARLDRVKNIPFALEVIRIIKDKIPAVKFIIVGDGDERNNITSLIKEYNLSGIVELAGMQTNINEYLNMFDVFIFPSFHEGFGISILEAVCTGLPCIINESLPKELDVSELVNRVPLDKNRWAEKLIQIYNMKSIRKTNSRVVEKSGYGITGNVAKWKKFYDEVTQCS